MRNNILVWVALLALALASCGPRKGGVLRAPSQTTGNVERPTEKPVEKEEEEENIETILTSSIALVLPFQLDRIPGTSMSEEDIKRSSLALDFYQGFQLGLDEVAGEDKLYTLQVLDSRDDAGQSANLAKSQEVITSSLIVGPVYPQEIRSFGASFTNPRVLQINPLAATMPTEFNLPNLVSVTPPISVHMRAISGQVADNYRDGDVIIIYNTNNNDHKQFINGFLGDIEERLPGATIHTVTSVTQLNDYLVESGKNHIVTGTTDRTQLKGLLDNMDDQYMDNNYAFQLYGHPLWNRFDFSPYSNFRNYNPVITSESHLDMSSRTARAFQQSYQESFGVAPSDYSYKGYDTGVYFGQLLDKYGDDYPDHITEETFEGLFSSYKFNHNDRWGYVNFGVKIKTYRSGSFVIR